MKKQKKFNLKDQYKKCFKYLSETKNYFYSVIVLFFIFSIIGFFVPTPDWVYEKLLELISELIKETENLGHFGLIKFIFLNNIKSSFYSMIFGLFFGLFSIISLIFNAYLLGFVASFSVKNGGIFILWKLLPHGIFELPAIFLSFGLGIKLGTILFKNKKRQLFEKYIKESLRIFLFIIFPLLVIAAIIEGTLIFLGK